MYSKFTVQAYIQHLQTFLHLKDIARPPILPFIIFLLTKLQFLFEQELNFTIRVLYFQMPRAHWEHKVIFQFDQLLVDHLNLACDWNIFGSVPYV